MSELSHIEIEGGRDRIRQWPVADRKALTVLTEPEARTVVLATALLDLRPVHEEITGAIEIDLRGER